MSQTQDEKEALKCTYGDCQNLQDEEHGEFCEDHYPHLTQEDQNQIAYKVKDGFKSGILDREGVRVIWELETQVFTQ